MSIEVEPAATPAAPATPALKNDALPAGAAAAAKSGRSYAWVVRGVVGLGVLVGLGLATGAALRSVNSGGDDGVLTHTVARGPLAVSVTEEGTLESSDNREIKCKVKGGSVVIEVVESGTIVKEGDVLVRLDDAIIEDNISLQKINYENALANKTTTENDVAVAEIAIEEYLQGTFRSEEATKEKDLVVAKSNLKAAQDALDHAQRLFNRGYISRLQLESHEDAVTHGDLEVRAKQIDLEVLRTFTRDKTLQELRSTLKAAQARLASDQAALELEEVRLQREELQLDNCVITAPADGMVIYPSAAEWKEQPDIEEGATVREDQVLLLMPNLDQMQVKVGIHESKIELVKVGMKSQIEINDRSVGGQVIEVASVTRPSGWWNGNLVSYDTMIRLDEQQGLKPGMKVAVEVFLAEYDDIVKVPVAAVVEQNGQFFCWVAENGDYDRREVQLGDSDEQFVIAKSGVAEGDEVVLNPIDVVDEAQRGALRPVEAGAAEAASAEGETAETEAKQETKPEKKPAGRSRRRQAGREASRQVGA